VAGQPGMQPVIDATRAAVTSQSRGVQLDDDDSVNGTSRPVSGRVSSILDRRRTDGRTVWYACVTGCSAAVD